MSIIGKIVKTIAQPTINKINGAIGEKKVDSKLNPLLFGKVEHRQINNLVLEDEMGKTHQIDHVEIRKNGIFCIETKNYIGLILGNENSKSWTQCLYNGQKNSLINPIKQNNSHIYQINKVLGKKYRINSVVVMVQNNADKIDAKNVVNLDDLKSYLNSFDDGTNYTIEEMDLIYQTLLDSSIKISNREHVKNIKKTQKELKEGICPRCGAQLVKREGKFGEFLGCSNYPECKFILKE